MMSTHRSDKLDSKDRCYQQILECLEVLDILIEANCLLYFSTYIYILEKNPNGNCKIMIFK